MTITPLFPGHWSAACASSNTASASAFDATQRLSKDTPSREPFAGNTEIRVKGRQCVRQVLRGIMYVCVYVCMCVCMYVCVCMYAFMQCM